MVDPHEVPTDVLAVLFEHMPEDRQHAAEHADEWRIAVAHVLTRWERDKDTVAEINAAGYVPHECRWESIHAKTATLVLNLKVTHVVQVCRGCGDVRTVQLNEHWTLDEILHGRQS